MNNNFITIGAILITLGIFFYFGFVANQTGVSDTLIESRSTQSANLIGRDIESALNRLDSFDLQTDIFSNPQFTRLRDGSREIQNQPFGKETPFDPIDRSISTTSTFSQTGVTNLTETEIQQLIQNGVRTAPTGTTTQTPTGTATQALGVPTSGSAPVAAQGNSQIGTSQDQNTVTQTN